MKLQEPYYSWLLKNVGENIDGNTRFVAKVKAMTASGPVEIDVNLDLTWFMLLHSKDEDKIVLDVALELLKDSTYIKQFQATLEIPEAKRLIAEYLLLKPLILVGLRSFIDFKLLNSPIDFISHALFIKRGSGADSIEVSEERLKIVKLVLDTGFKLTGDVPPKSMGVAVHKILTMPIGDERFTITAQLLAVGYKLFSDTPENNNEIGVMLIENRENPECKKMINDNISVLKNLSFKVADSMGNLADYFYWVKEDLTAVDFIRGTLKLEITP